MTVKKDFLEHWRELKSTLKPMTFSEKIDHLWTYYKEYLFWLALIIVIVSIVITGINNKSKETLLSGQAVNISLSEEASNYLSANYAKSLKINEKKQVIRLGHNYFSDLNNSTNYDSDYASAMRPIALAETKQLDYLLLDKTALEYYKDQELFMDVSKILTDLEMEQWSDCFVYLNENENNSYPVAIDISKLLFIQQNVNIINDNNPVYIAFAVNTPRIDACRDLWERILDWNS